MGQPDPRIMFDADVRIERMIWIPGVVHCSSQPEVFDEFCEWLDDDQAQAIFDALPCLQEAKPDLDTEFIAEILAANVTPGFFIEVATPVRTMSRGDCYEYSWGNYYTKWLYCPTFEGIPAASVEWVESMIARDKEKAAALSKASGKGA